VISPFVTVRLVAAVRSMVPLTPCVARRPSGSKSMLSPSPTAVLLVK
jgi:hypothetical protein